MRLDKSHIPAISIGLALIAGTIAVPALSRATPLAPKEVGSAKLNTKTYTYEEPTKIFLANGTPLTATGAVSWTVCNPPSCSQPTIISATFSVTVPHGRYLTTSKLSAFSNIQVFNQNKSLYGTINGTNASCIYAQDAVNYCGGAVNLHMTPQRQVTMRHNEIIKIDLPNGATNWASWSFDHTWG